MVGKNEGNGPGGIIYVDGKLQTWCGKGCAWNCTHSTKYHGKWKKDPNKFQLPESHPNRMATAGSSKLSNTGTSLPNSTSSQPPPTNNSSGSGRDVLTIQKAKAADVFDHFEHSTLLNPYSAALISASV